MPSRSILSAAEHDSLLASPDTKDDPIRYYALSDADLSIIGALQTPWASRYSSFTSDSLAPHSALVSRYIRRCYGRPLTKSSCKLNAGRIRSG